ncbi:hypothetical protein GGX14DRAFT_652541 [Mycena pura]|uniref:Uncharacterized protein n=1 Tax=Mycena pura TaxID=153505 RepID=A0AAD6Y922_9AGAR|nr:hypothetical protein GGX14DRAFT_652541 [Mycena pura]
MSLGASDNDQFHEAADFKVTEIAEYRRVMFPAPLSNPTNALFLAADDAPRWMTARGYTLYQEFNPAALLSPYHTYANAKLRHLRAYREQVVGPAYQSHQFFGLERPQDWITPGPFNLWMQLSEEQEARGRSQAPSRSHTPASSDDGSPPRSRTMSPDSQYTDVSRSCSASVHGSSFSPAPSRANSPPLPTLDLDNVFDEPTLSGVDAVHRAPTFVAPAPAVVASSAKPKAARRKGKGKAKDEPPRIRITREMSVDRIIPITSAPPSWTVTRDDAAYLLNITATPEVLVKNSKPRSIDAYIKAEDQDAWDGSTGHAGPRGDVWVYAFSESGDRLGCKGVCVCEYVSEELFGDCERFEPDPSAMVDLWNHELNANEQEAASPEAILSRFYTRIKTTKCKKANCDGVPVMVPLSNGYGKSYFIGCSKWCAAERWQHRYHPSSSNVDEEVFRYILDNDGRMPDGAQVTINAQCVLTVHPRLKIKYCPFSHIINGVIQPATMLEREIPPSADLRPFYPDANCRIFVMDGELAQVNGFGEFLAQYNSPTISGILENNSIGYVLYCLKTCIVHFNRCLDELNRADVPLSVIVELKKIIGYKTQEDVEKWHAYCQSVATAYVAVNGACPASFRIQVLAEKNPPDWYVNKDKPWYLSSINPFLSKIAAADYAITPNTTNLAESAHAGTNAQTSTKLALLPAILRKYARDNEQADQLCQMMRSGVLRRRWNGPAQREKRSEQRKLWASKASFERNEVLVAFDELTQEREEGQEEWRFSLSRQKEIEVEIEGLQAELKRDKKREDLKTEVKVLRLEVNAEKQARREWVARRGEIDAELRELRAGPLKGVPLVGRRRHDRSLRSETISSEPGAEGEAGVPPDVPNDCTGTPVQPPGTDSHAIINAGWDEQSVQLYLRPEPEYTPMDWQPDINLDPELEPNHAILSGNIPWVDESGTAYNVDGTVMTVPASNSVLAESAIPAALSTNPAMQLSSTALEISQHTVSAPVAPLRRSERKHARETSPVTGLSHQHKAKRGRQALDLDWEVYDDEGNAISAREFAVRYPEEWEERFASTYDHLLGEFTVGRLSRL